MLKQEKGEKFIFLEISGEQGNIDTYSIILKEALNLGITRILIACIWDKEQEKGKELLKEVCKLCEILGIRPFSTTQGYKDKIYETTMVGNVVKTKDAFIPNLINMISLEDYKKSITQKNNSQEDKKLTKAEIAMDSFMERFNDGELTNIEVSPNKDSLVSLDTEFINNQTDAFQEMLKSPLMEKVNQATDKNTLTLENKKKN